MKPKVRRRKERRVKITTALLEAMGWEITEEQGRVTAKLTYNARTTTSSRSDQFVLKKRGVGDWMLGNVTVYRLQDVYQAIYDAGHDDGGYTKLRQIQAALGISR